MLIFSRLQRIINEEGDEPEEDVDELSDEDESDEEEENDYTEAYDSFVILFIIFCIPAPEYLRRESPSAAFRTVPVRPDRTRFIVTTQYHPEFSSSGSARTRLHPRYGRINVPTIPRNNRGAR